VLIFLFVQTVLSVLRSTGETWKTIVDGFRLEVNDVRVFDNEGAAIEAARAEVVWLRKYMLSLEFKSSQNPGSLS
jgi:hypothetical protein